MSASRNRKHRRIQPYAWLGAGAVTIGMGTALLGGAAVAFAETGPDTGAATTTASDTATAAAPKSDPAPHRKTRASRANTGASAAADTSTAADSPAPSSAVRSRASVATPAPAAAVDTVLTQLDQAPSAVAESVAPARVARRAVALPDVAANWLAPRTASARAAASLVAPTPNPPSSLAPNANVSWLPGGTCTNGAACVVGIPPNQEPITPATSTLPQIVPGSYVAQAKEDISAAQGLIFQETFGSGNIFAGVAGLVPELFLATSSLSLGLWSATNDFSKSFLASTAGIPVIAQIAQLNVMANMLLPAISDFSLGAAGFFLPVAGFLGADVSGSTAAVKSAQQNGKVYSVVPVSVYGGTQPLVNASINGGPSRKFLVDTGASGLLTTDDKVDVSKLGDPVGTGSINFSGNDGEPYTYTTYNAPVDFGGGAVTGQGSTINVISNTEANPNQVENFQKFIFYADGILGVGANSDGPGTTPLLTATLPGELKDGALLFQGFWPLGLGGFLVFGLNPLPVNVSLPGAPDAFIKISAGGGTASTAPAIIDSGGVFGTICDTDIAANLTEVSTDPDYPGTYVKPGVKLTATAPDGTVLYTYTTVQYGTPVIPESTDQDYMNTGNAAFSQNPVYINYGYGNGTVNYGIGSTDFSIW